MAFARSYTMYRASIYDSRDINAIKAWGKFHSEEEYAETVKREEEIRDRRTMRSN